ncbi:MAG: hypothetical protein JWO32_533 [Bacteroidetes bacterium]|nr:hypothetical protein [Bacteroidota bacterium]
MKTLILMTLGVALLRQVAKYYKINSVQDAIKFAEPFVNEIIPKQKFHLKHHLN